MARQVRVERAGGWYHVTSRGIERREIYKDDRDRYHWLELLAEAKEMFRLVVHSYVLLPNHFHCLIETPEANLARAMHWLNTSYTVWFNKRHRRVGPLFQGRYKGIVVDPAEWGLELSRYIHLNPVRIRRLGLDKQARQADRLGLRGKPDAEVVRVRVAHLRKYRWSSYPAYIGLVKAPQWLEIRVVLRLGGRGAVREQRRRYRVHVEDAIREGLPESPWDQLTARLILGGKEFVKEISKLVIDRGRECHQVKDLPLRPDLADVIGVIEELKGELWDEFRDRHGDWGRDLALYLGRKECGLTLRQLGEAVGGVDYAAVSAAVKRFEKRIQKDRKLATLVKRGRQILNVET